MSLNTFGHLFRVTTWGESHGPAIGCVIDGCPPGIPITEAEIQTFLDKRRPGQSKYTTQRKEPDTVEILSGEGDPPHERGELPDVPDGENAQVRRQGGARLVARPGDFQRLGPCDEVDEPGQVVLHPVETGGIGGLDGQVPDRRARPQPCGPEGGCDPVAVSLRPHVHVV